MSNYRPNLDNQIPLVLLVPTWTNVKGVRNKTYPTIEEALNDDKLFFGSFKTYGGTEREVNGIYSIVDTATVETWFRPDIKSDCAIALETGEIYEIMNEPEDINKRHQFLKFKVKRIKGGV